MGITRTHLGWIHNLLFNVSYFKVFKLLFIVWVGLWVLSIGSSRLQPLHSGANVASFQLPCHHWSDRSVCGVLLNINSYRGIRLGWHEQKHYYLKKSFNWLPQPCTCIVCACLLNQMPMLSSVYPKISHFLNSTCLQPLEILTRFSEMVQELVAAILHDCGPSCSSYIASRIINIWILYLEKKTAKRAFI